MEVQFTYPRKIKELKRKGKTKNYRFLIKTIYKLIL